MARLTLDMPENYLFSTEIPIRINDINYGGHLGNDSMLALIQEARVRFLKYYHYTELNIEGLGLVIADTAILYKAEGFYGDLLQIDIALGDFNKYGCDIFYLVSNKQTAVEVAHVKTGIVFFDYQKRKIQAAPQGFIDKVVKEA